jgi:hypothetical protein
MLRMNGGWCCEAALTPVSFSRANCDENLAEGALTKIVVFWLRLSC